MTKWVTIWGGGPCRSLEFGVYPILKVMGIVWENLQETTITNGFRDSVRGIWEALIVSVWTEQVPAIKPQRWRFWGEKMLRGGYVLPVGLENSPRMGTGKEVEWKMSRVGGVRKLSQEWKEEMGRDCLRQVKLRLWISQWCMKRENH